MTKSSGETANQKNSKVKNRREAVVQRKLGKKYRKDPKLPTKIVELLADYCCAERAAKILDVSPSQVHRYKEIALRMGIIVPYCGQNPRLYEKGPRYYLRREKGWWSKVFEPIECRVHPGFGNAHIFRTTKECMGSLEIPINPGDGTLIYQKFLSGPLRFKGYNLHKGRFSFPKKILGYEGSSYVEARVMDNGNVTLSVSLPELRMTHMGLDEDGDDPYWLVIAYFENVLMRNCHWSFHDSDYHGLYHYAIPLDTIFLYCHELAEGVQRLRKGDNEEDLGIYIDRSIPNGELETVHLQVVKDILGILEIERRKLNGTHLNGAALGE